MRESGHVLIGLVRMASLSISCTILATQNKALREDDALQFSPLRELYVLLMT